MVSVTCWICFQEEVVSESDFSTDSDWVAPCNCRGTLQWVHRTCLSEWISKFLFDKQDDSPSVQCPNCLTPYLYKKSMSLRILSFVIRIRLCYEKLLLNILLSSGISCLSLLFWSHGVLISLFVCGQETLEQYIQGNVFCLRYGNYFYEKMFSICNLLFTFPAISCLSLFSPFSALFATVSSIDKRNAFAPFIAALTFSGDAFKISQLLFQFKKNYESSEHFNEEAAVAPGEFYSTEESSENVSTELRTVLDLSNIYNFSLRFAERLCFPFVASLFGRIFASEWTSASNTSMIFGTIIFALHKGIRWLYIHSSKYLEKNQVTIFDAKK